MKDYLLSKIDFIATKISAITFLSVTPAIGVSFFQGITGWYFDNRLFMSFVAGAIFIDHLLGSYVHKKIKDDFSWKENRNGLFWKIAGSVIGYVLFEMFYQIVEDVEFIAMYLKVLLQLVTFFYPAMSAAVNLSIVTKGRIPPKWLMKKFVKFEETGDLTVFKTNDNEKNPNNSDSFDANPSDSH